MRKTILFAAFLFAGSVALSASVAAESGHQHGHGAPHWGYEGDAGPEHWGDLAPEFGTCKSGHTQSPIDISGAGKGDSKIEFSYMVGPVEVLNNGHTIQANMKDPGHSAVIDGKRYNLLQFHLHAPGENTLNGKAYAMELHLVHKSDDGKLAVVGVFFEEGAENHELAKVWSALPLNVGESRGVNMVSPKVLLPKDTSYYSFSGSLTTPPCSEGVSWNVMKKPVTVSAAQIEVFVKLVGHNARPIQAGNGRKVTLN